MRKQGRAIDGHLDARFTYVDDVYINGFAGSIVDFNNIDQVEVLKGPQGTLFGRNATGGVIHIVTKDPSADSSLTAQVGYGNYDTYESQVYGTTAIAPTVAADIAFQSREQDHGYGHDLATGQDINLGKEYGVRSKVKWTPSDATTVIFEADHYWTDEDFGINPSVQPGTYSAGLGTFVGDYNNQIVNAFSGGKSLNSDEVDGQTITIEQKTHFATIKSITARRVVSGQTDYDQSQGPLDAVSLQINSTVEQYSEELRLSSLEGTQLAGHDLHLQGGVYVLKLDEGVRPLDLEGLAFGTSELQPYSKSYTRSYAGYTDGTLALTSDTNLTLGARITTDQINNTSYTTVNPAGAVATTSNPLYQHTDATQPTWRAILDHKLTPDVLTYASVSRGFKSGGFSLLSAGTGPTRPEELEAYAVGVKSDWLDHRFQANAEAFYYDYNNQQVAVIQNGGSFEINAAKSRIYGLDLSLVAAPTSDLTLRSNFGYLHGRYLAFPGAPEYVQQPATCLPTPHQLPGALIPGDLQCSFDASGKPTIRSPTASGNFGFDYVLYRSVIGNFSWAGNYFRTSSFNWDPSGQYPEHSYGLLDSALTWNAPSSKYHVQLWGTNLTNTYYDTFISESAPAIQRGAGDPRKYGIRFGVNF
jgi:iron complex outermembrane receptor protein